MEPIKISIAKEFSSAPGARLRVDGEHSGEEFRDTLLEPRFLEAKTKGVSLEVTLDGTAGYGSGFIEEAFGGLARKYGIEDVLSVISFISNEEPYLKDDIIEYVKGAKG